MVLPVGQRIPRGALTRFIRWRADRARSRNVVRAHDSHLRRGLYVIAGETLWRHWRVPVPNHLGLTKGHRRTAPARSWSRRLAGASRARLARLMLPSMFVKVRGRRGDFTLAVSAHDGGVVLLAPHIGQVVRTYGANTVSSEHVALRERFARHVPAPAFRVLEGGQGVMESLIEGRHLVDLGPEAQVDVVVELLRCFTELTRVEGEQTCQPLVTEALEAVRVASVPESFRSAIESMPFRALARTWPLVPAATDANIKNLIIAGDGSPVTIDLGQLRLDPFFYFPIGVIAELRSTVLQAYLDGRLDDALGPLFDAAGAELPLDAVSRHGLLSLRIAIASRNEAVRGAGDETAAMSRAVRRRWEALQGGVLNYG